jgi:peptidoglycan/LPS O-acetylase OafA/YrhL
MNKRLKILDSLRGIAAILVVLHHFLVFNGQEVKLKVRAAIWELLNFLSELNVEAVLFFFVLSGFCIALALKGNPLNNKAFINHYLYRRFKRILPIYWIALGLSLLVGLLSGKYIEEPYSWQNLLGNLLFLQTSLYATNYWFSPYGYNGPLWSLSYEMFFYLFFPLYTLLISLKPMFRSVYRQVIILVLVSLACIVVNKLVYIPYLAFMSYFIIWYAGYLAAEYYLFHKKRNALFISTLAVFPVIFYFKSQLPSTALYELFKGLFIASLFYWALKFKFIWTKKWMSAAITIVNVIFNRIGHGSYALYAFHYPVLILMNYYGWALWHQLLLILILALVCPYIETRLANLKINFLKRNYI